MAGRCRSKSSHLYIRRLEEGIRSRGLGQISIHHLRLSVGLGTILAYVCTSFIPGKDGTSRHDYLVVGQAESIGVAQVCCLAANAGAGALSIVGKSDSIETIAVYLAWKLLAVRLSINTEQTSQK